MVWNRKDAPEHEKDLFFLDGNYCLKMFKAQAPVYPATPWPRAQNAAVNWSGWFNKSNGNFSFGEYGDVWQEFVAPDDGQVRVWLECKGNAIGRNC